MRLPPGFSGTYALNAGDSGVKILFYRSRAALSVFDVHMTAGFCASLVDQVVTIRRDTAERPVKLGVFIQPRFSRLHAKAEVILDQGSDPRDEPGADRGEGGEEELGQAEEATSPGSGAEELEAAPRPSHGRKPARKSLLPRREKVRIGTELFKKLRYADHWRLRRRDWLRRRLQLALESKEKHALPERYFLTLDEKSYVGQGTSQHDVPDEVLEACKSLMILFDQTVEQRLRSIRGGHVYHAYEDVSAKLHGQACTVADQVFLPALEVLGGLTLDGVKELRTAHVEFAQGLLDQRKSSRLAQEREIFDGVPESDAYFYFVEFAILMAKINRWEDGRFWSWAAAGLASTAVLFRDTYYRQGHARIGEYTSVLPGDHDSFRPFKRDEYTEAELRTLAACFPDGLKIAEIERRLGLVYEEAYREHPLSMVTNHADQVKEDSDREWLPRKDKPETPREWWEDGRMGGA